MDRRDPQEPEFPDEVEVDLGDEGTEPIECVGEYDSVELYLKALLGELMHADIVWILEHLDYQAVLQRFEADGSRYVCHEGAIYRCG